MAHPLAQSCRDTAAKLDGEASRLLKEASYAVEDALSGKPEKAFRVKDARWYLCQACENGAPPGLLQAFDREAGTEWTDTPRAEASADVTPADELGGSSPGAPALTPALDPERELRRLVKRRARWMRRYDVVRLSVNGVEIELLAESARSAVVNSVPEEDIAKALLAEACAARKAEKMHLDAADRLAAWTKVDEAEDAAEDAKPGEREVLVLEDPTRCDPPRRSFGSPGHSVASAIPVEGLTS